ncbi:hypothetical protein [Nocardia sp. NPDC005745]|uniref:hypothetical protein n=1 Tax=Nocardia sp. NPDC005745 TaxID=3157061 RepID=UPI0033D0F62A
MDTSPRPNTVIVVRAWMESGQPAGFRARLLGADPDDPSSSLLVADPTHVLEAVRRWLDHIVQGGSKSS